MRPSFPVAAAAAVALVLTAYSNHFAGGFHFDDHHVIQQNLYLRSLANVPRFFVDAMTFSSLPANATYRPLLSVTYAVDYAIGGGLVSWSFHLTQFLLHLAVAACVYRLIARVLEQAAPARGNRWAALAGAALFAVHTANTETVNYLSARSDELSTLALLVGFLVYVELPGARRLHLHALPMLVGALAKPPAVLLGPLLLAYALLVEEGLRSRERMRAAIARTAPTIALGLAALLFVEAMNPPEQTYGGPPRSIYLRTQMWALLRYLGLFVLPVGLSADTDLQPIARLADPRIAAGAFAAVALLALAFLVSRSARGRVVSFGVVWFFVGLLPSSSLFPLAEMMNEHRIYLPFIGLTLAAAAPLAAAIERVSASGAPARRRRAAALTAAVVVLLGAHSVGTFRRNRVWRSEEALWADVVRKSPRNGRAWMNYGLTQMEAGRPERALELYREAERINPAYPYVHTNLGIVLHALGRTEEAERSLRHALALAPNFVEGHFYLARFLRERGDGPRALDHARRATELSPGFGPARALVLDLLYASGRADELRETAAATLAVLPSHPEALAYRAGAPGLPTADPAALATLAEQRAVAGDLLGAAVARRRAAELAPTPDAVAALRESLRRLGFGDPAGAVTGP